MSSPPPGPPALVNQFVEVEEDLLHNLCSNRKFEEAEAEFDQMASDVGFALVLRQCLRYRCQENDTGCYAFLGCMNGERPPLRLMKKMLEVDPTLLNVEVFPRGELGMLHTPLTELCLNSPMAHDDIDVFRLVVRHDPGALVGWLRPDGALQHVDLLARRADPSEKFPRAAGPGYERIRELVGLLAAAHAASNYKAIEHMCGSSPQLDERIAASPAVCGGFCDNTEGLKPCSCRTVSFCCKNCQRSVWRKHKAVCRAVMSGEMKAEE